MSYHRFNYKSLYNHLMNKGFWVRETRLLINDIYNCFVCIKITPQEQLITWVEPRNATIDDICKATDYVENITKEIEYGKTNQMDNTSK